MKDGSAQELLLLNRVLKVKIGHYSLKTFFGAVKNGPYEYLLYNQIDRAFQGAGALLHVSVEMLKN